MTKKQFWQRASNWGLICGGALFVMNLVSWGLGLEAKGSTAIGELLLFIVIPPTIIISGRQNARLSGPQGYSYSRAVGFVFAVMLFAGVVYGVGRFLMVNFIARDYYDAINAIRMEKVMALYGNTPMAEQISGMSRMLSNPFVLIFQEIFNLGIKGGFLGLFAGAFLKTKPDLFAQQNTPVNPAGDTTDGDR